MKRVLFVFGTRPEAIKLAPLYLEFLKHRDDFDVKVCVTGQHREMLDQVLDLFGIGVDFDLKIMKKDQDLFDITSAALLGLREVFLHSKPDYIMVHGDTTTTMATGIAGFYAKIPVVHIEAGLRTGNLQAPWPEEFNRKVVGIITHLHFAPTEQARQNLLAEKVPPEKIFVTGNTVIDALILATARINSDQILSKSLAQRFPYMQTDKKIVLLTGHRRENHGVGFEEIFLAISDIVDTLPHVDVVYPIHLNPKVREPAERILSDKIRQNRVHLIEPQDYLSFVYLMKKSSLIITDSGGVQEEAPQFGVPILVTREVTERPEAVVAGTVTLVGAHRDLIVKAAIKALSDENRKDGLKLNPYGDGFAARRIVEEMKKQQINK